MLSTFKCYSLYSKACYALLPDANEPDIDLDMSRSSIRNAVSYMNDNSFFGLVASVYMAKNGQVTAKADFVTKSIVPLHLNVNMTRNIQNNIRNEFNVPKSV